MQPPGGDAPDSQPSVSGNLPDPRGRRSPLDTGAAQPTRPLVPLQPLGARPDPQTVPGSQRDRRTRRRRDSRPMRANAPPPAAGSAAPPRQAPPGMPARPAARRDARTSGLYLPWWSLVIMVAVVGAITLVLVLTLSALAEPKTPGDQAPRVQVITPQPTLSQSFLSGAAPQQTEGQGLWPTPIRPAQPTPTMALPTPIPSPPLPPGNITIGVLVKVVGVGATGLNIRSAPGTGDTNTPRFVAQEESVFVVVEGPQTADGLEWWRLEDPDDSQRYGWAARNYLEVISE